MDESIRNMIMRRKAWDFLDEFLPLCTDIIGIKNYEEFCEIILTSALESSINDLGSNPLANKVLISYDIYFDEIRQYFEEEK